MTTVYLSPVFNAWQGFNASGQVLAGGLLYAYQAGTSTPEATYTTSAGSIANTNPIVLGSDGRPPSEIWLTAGQAYKFILQDSLGNPVGPTFDNVYGVNDPVLDPAFPTISEWNAYSGTPTFINATSFSVAGNAVATFQPLRRVEASISTGTLVYGTVASSTYNGSITTVVLTMDAASLDSGLTVVSPGLLNSTHPSYPAVIGSAPYVIGAGTGDAITATLAATVTTLADDFQVEVKATAANTLVNPTFALTLGSTNTGAFPIVKYNNLPLVSEDIAGAGALLQLRWSSTFSSWILTNPSFGPVYPFSATNRVIIFTTGGTQMVPAGFAFKATVQGGGSGSSQVPGSGGLSSLVYNGVTLSAAGGVNGAGNAAASGGDLNINGSLGSSTGASGGLMGPCITPTGYGYGGPMTSGANYQTQGSSGATVIKWFPPSSIALTATVVVGGAGGNGGPGIVILEY